ncbi:DUF1697 domain-containing protein [Mesorhizobium sp. M7A.F.Ca.US.001.04.1.1]|uniref:DUF1697 domain-containing protein n=2 Tax=Mesorhizobium TaxID=68287 RepID=UPI000FCB30FE|nr:MULTISPECIES: DUF1697 domain-containing protein [unclassified Mesorhizobium]RUX72686.1 DUF1697 domain-containing protein [Mesorhizobium sp. M7A.F.Ca.US.005.03.1.1]RUY16408.1 DUF1697 domain-containing protein [Mesorhizobium sp. M7A.F.Ca.US.005.03.2.1]RUY28977.1 DUF1697 domain-containing protein [Mesorhizobium sp. M7A.F.Ca.US.001.04.2.1]RUY41451.1 DUF1697 domain-containing protein [Mesorhizobium sp. M7A.F.Ca.US.001.04.1.1]RVA14352.1 DUF1697 domain-containing protein [Mesorhizobium sp. M7A.F.C
MQTYVALLYSIILGEGRRVVMADLKAMAEDLGLKNPRTLVATGNLVFEAPATDIADLEQRLEAAFEKTFGRHVDIIVRGAEDWLKLAAGNPFPADSAKAGDQVAVRVMRKPAPVEAVTGLQAYAGVDEKVTSVGGDIWVVFSRERPSSRLLAAMNHKRMGTGTSRNWNTVRRLAEMLG